MSADFGVYVFILVLVCRVYSLETRIIKLESKENHGKP